MHPHKIWVENEKEEDAECEEQQTNHNLCNGGEWKAVETGKNWAGMQYLWSNFCIRNSFILKVRQGKSPWQKQFQKTWWYSELEASWAKRNAEATAKASINVRWKWEEMQKEM